MNIEEIQSQMDAVVEFAKSENRALTDEEVTKFEGLEKDLVAAGKTVEIAKRNDAYKLPNVTLLSQMPKTIKSRDSQEFALDRYLRGVKEAGKELTFSADGGVIVGIKDAAKFAQTETTTAGGYMVPTVTQDVMVKIQKAFGGIANRAAHINTSHGAPINFPSIDDTGNSSAIADINAAPGSAGADLAFTQVSLSAFKYAATGTGETGLAVPRELIDDALFDVTALVTEMLGVRLARKMASDYAQGVGTTAPNGLFHQTSDVLTPSGGLVEATANATLQGLVYALDPAYVNENCVWIMNWATAGKIAAFVDSANRPLLQPNYQSGLGSEVGMSTLLGFPVQIDQGSPAFTTTATTNPGAVNESFIAFGDVNQAFLIRDVQGISIAVDPYTNIGSNQVLYYGYARTDSVVRNRNAYVLLDGYHS